jgi:hypothetical protein
LTPIHIFGQCMFSTRYIYHKEIEKKCFKFIWNGKPDKIKRNLIINSYERGGLQMIDIKSYFIALNATWVSRLVTGNISNWKLIPLKYFNAIGNNWLVFSMNLDSTKSLRLHIYQIKCYIIHCFLTK